MTQEMIAGIEIHQQLETKQKLFCSCSTAFDDDEKSFVVQRKLRPVAGEMGDIDIAALHETLKNKTFLYKTYEHESCLVDSDSEPPHNLNSEALDIGLQVALLLNCEIPDEIHVMRKTVVDGSNTAGFQRTAIIGLNGYIVTEFGNVGIVSVAIEEDSCQIAERGKTKTTYGLNRLGIPLIEITTAPDITSPEQTKAVAAKLGMILRSTQKVKRGLGTIRQDLNVSIPQGTRVEIKGAQDLRLIPTSVKYEIKRQQTLSEMKTQVQTLTLLGTDKPLIVSEMFDETEFAPYKKVLENKGNIYCLVIQNAKGLFTQELQPGKTLGREIHDYAASLGSGITHSDEDLKKYGLNKQFDQIRKTFDLQKNDLIITIGAPSKTEVEKIAHRLQDLRNGVWKDVRRANKDGTSSFLRPLPGAARLYPETDIPAIFISEEKKNDLKAHLPVLIEDKHNDLVSQGIPQDLAMQIVKEGRADLIEKISRLDYKKPFIATIVVSGIKDLKTRDNLDTSVLTDEKVIDVFKHLKGKEATKDMILSLFKKICEKPTTSIKELVDSTDTLSEDDVRKIIRDIIDSHKEVYRKPNKENAYMGLVMKEVRGKVPGNLVMKLILEELKK